LDEQVAGDDESCRDAELEEAMRAMLEQRGVTKSC
jgi:hypothetical protein